MRGINKQLMLPTLLVGVVLISGMVLAESSKKPTQGQDEPQLLAQLPKAGERQIHTSPMTQDLEVDVITSTTPDQTSIKTTIPTPATPVVPTTTISTPSSSQTPSQTTSAEPTATKTPVVIQATLVIQGPGISLKKTLEFEDGATVYTLLQQASKKFDFSLKVSQHSSLGVFVEGIAGIQNDAKSNRYWLYYVNGQFASRGVSAQIIKEGDLIKWSYE